MGVLHRQEIEAIGDSIDPVAFVLGRRRGDWVVDDVMPIADLVGWRADPASWAIAAVVSGQARCADGAVTVSPDVRAERASGGSGTALDDVGPNPLRVTVAVSRTGEVVGRVGTAGAHHESSPSGGRLLDTLKRNLDLPTARPPESTGRLLAVLWLRAIVDSWVAMGGSELGWGALLRAHPAVQLLLARDEILRRDELEAVVEVTPSTWTWTVLRDAESRPGSTMRTCPPGAAGWMDIGMYARWVLADLPSAAPLWQQVEKCATAEAACRLEHCLSSYGVDVRTR